MIATMFVEVMLKKMNVESVTDQVFLKEDAIVKVIVLIALENVVVP